VSVITELVAKSGFALMDGATGTELFKRGLMSGDPPEAWNVDHPDRIRSAYSAYVDAGSDIFLTNSFGGTHYRLALHKLDDRVVELNEWAAKLGREVADAAMAADPERTVLVAGSMGPTGELMDPMGTMTPDTCTAAFAEQASGLADGGADLLWIETMSSVEEVEAAVAGAREACDLPVCVAMSFDTAGRTMMGVTGTMAAELATRLEVDAVGANCGNNLPDTEAAVAEMRAVNPELILISKGNAGIPEWHGTDLHYSGSPEVMAAYAARARDMGVQLIGGCCGSSSEHIALMRAVLDGKVPVPDVDPMEGGTPTSANDETGTSGSAADGARKRGGRRRRGRG
jgi:5-methyltetrahydrofolate--homocysteine methyltransferase